MLGFLFPGLTAAPQRGVELFDRVSARAREPHWYVEGRVPDTIDGRFRVLATISALMVVRLERCGEAGNAASVTFTERFVEVMESEHREMGLGDPTLGKTVRRLVGALARRVEFWRSAVDGTTGWETAVQRSLYADAGPSEAVRHAASALENYWRGLQRAPDSSVIDGDAA